MEPLDVFFLVDGSSSIKSYQWPSQLLFVKRLVENSLNVEGDRAGVFQFSLSFTSGGGNVDIGNLEFPLGADLGDIAAGVAGIEQLRGWTPTKGGIHAVIDLFKQSAPRPDNQRLLVILTDGVPTMTDANHSKLPNQNQNPCYTGHWRNLTPYSTTADMLTAEDIMTVVITVQHHVTSMNCLVEDPPG